MTIKSTTFVLATLKTWCARTTRSPLTIMFFLSMLANFVTQATLHSVVLSYYTRNRDFVRDVIDHAGVQRGFTVLRHGVLEICSGIPTVHGTACRTVYNSSAISAPTSALGVQCAEGLIWLENYLINSKTEEILYLVLESWLVVVSLVALLNESIPHLIVVLAAQLVNTGWISYRIARDMSANRSYNEVIVSGTCGGFDILGGSWQYNMFFVTLGFSIAALLCMAVLVFQLIKLYSRSKLSSVGSPPVMNWMLKWRLWMRVFLQFTTFFMLASASTWYDKRKSVAKTASYDSKSILYDVGFYVVAVITVPWLMLGTQSVSRENRLLFLVYAILSMVLLVISGLWFGSTLYQYEYLDWRTFSCATTMADGLLVITCILSVVCRLNFGKGLAHFLVVEQKLQASGFAYDTFLNDPGNDRRSVGVKQVLIPPLPRPALDQSMSSLKTWRRPLSMCSIGSSVFATWLAYTTKDDPEMGGLKDEKPAGTVIIPEDGMSMCGTHSISDDGTSTLVGDDEKQTIVL